MKYLEVSIWWGAINIYMLIVAFAVGYNLFYFMIYFFTGFFLILVFGLVEVTRNRKKLSSLMS